MLYECPIFMYKIAYHKSGTTERGIFSFQLGKTQTTTYSGIEPDEAIKSE